MFRKGINKHDIISIIQKKKKNKTKTSATKTQNKVFLEKIQTLIPQSYCYLHVFIYIKYWFG